MTYRPVGADALLRRNLLIWGLGGVIVPFVGIKLIDMLLLRRLTGRSHKRPNVLEASLPCESDSWSSLTLLLCCVAYPLALLGSRPTRVHREGATAASSKRTASRSARG